MKVKDRVKHTIVLNMLHRILQNSLGYQRNLQLTPVSYSPTYCSRVAQLQQCEAVFRRPRKNYDMRRRPRILKIIRSLLDRRAYIQCIIALYFLFCLHNFIFIARIYIYMYYFLILRTYHVIYINLSVKIFQMFAPIYHVVQLHHYNIKWYVFNQHFKEIQLYDSV